MSDLQRSFAKAKLAGVPFEPPEPLPPPPPPHPSVQEDWNIAEEEDAQADDDELLPLPSPRDDSSSSSASSASSAGTIRPSPSKHLFARPKGSMNANKRSHEPLPWTDFFEQELYLEQPLASKPGKIIYHVYISPPTDNGPLFVTHHGAGSSGLSFAVVASEVRKLLPTAGILSFDARGHGSTVVHENQSTEDSAALDLGLETLSNDVVNVINLTKERLAWPVMPDLILVGHSLGGAVMTEVTKRGELGNSVLAYTVLDVVEGSAIDALQSMHTYLSSRPKSFPTMASAISWHTRTRTIRTEKSARVSVPALLVPSSDVSQSGIESSTAWTWRTDLAATQPFWENWFVGLSSKFLSAKGGKLLLLAGTDRLDKELMIGQMQGKYQLQVFPDSGHFIQEDLPEKTAMVLVDFYKRNNRKGLVLPPKVGDLLKRKETERGKGADEQSVSQGSILKS
ncbi:Protein phosphatase methylesterase 1 [Agyrium rufum]|nr:Protein phosphatase methylesterase 1 [Agyrium rufum]